MTPTVPTQSQIQAAKQRFGIIGNSPALIAAVERALRVAPINLTVLIQGESGTGKEFFPKIIHAYGVRKHVKYIAVNCGAIPEGTIDSELFGHEKGAFTGAVASRKGYFEEADGGTIFLDEVAELPLSTQARLLRVLESGEFIKVGSSEVQKADVRIVAATNVDMAKAVADGKFREDLYYRLSTVTISVPPLRDRGSDIALLARKFASDFSENNHIPPVTFSPEAINMLEHCRWPGNVRQLKNVVEQVALFEGGTRVEPEALREILGPAASVSSLSASGSHPAGSRTYADEREILFNMIFRMQRRLDSLTDELDSMREQAAKSSANSWNNAKASAADHAEELRFLPIIQSPSDNFNEVETTHYTEVTPPASAAGVPTLEDTEKETIRRSLERNNGKRKATARELNISERTLYRKIREYGLE